MQIKKFSYKGTLREVLVTQEDDNYIKGFDISKMDTEDVREAMRVKTNSIDFSKMTEEEGKEAYRNLKELHSCYRNFKKTSIQP